MTGAVGAIKVRIWVNLPEDGHSDKNRRQIGFGV